MAADDQEPEEAGEWADRLWGPHDPDAFDLRPELLTKDRAPDTPTSSGVEPTGIPMDDRAKAAWEARLTEAIQELKETVRSEIAANEVRLGGALDGGGVPSTDTLTAWLESARKEIREDFQSSLNAVLVGQAQAWETRRWEIDTTLADLGRQIAALETTIQRNGSELRDGITDALVRSDPSQARLFEQGLGALAKAVADERRSTAAMVGGSLAAIDQSLLEAYQSLHGVLGTILEETRQSATNASKAVAETQGPGPDVDPAR